MQESAARDAEFGCAGMSVHFGGVRAVDEVTFTLRRGEIVGLIGPNGAGKSTLVNVLSGFQEPTAGTVTLAGRDITGLSSHMRARAGIARTFQAARLFAEFSVAENLAAGALGAGLSPRQAHARACEIASLLRLEAALDLPASSLPHGVERLVAIGRALAGRPGFLLLDEPAAGLNEAESEELGDILVRVRDVYDCGLCVIEHDMRLIMSRCERIHVLDSGRTIAHGPPAKIQNDPQVVAAYLGVAE